MNEQDKKDRREHARGFLTGVLEEALSKYLKAFGQPHYGKPKQVAALMELIPEHHWDELEMIVPFSAPDRLEALAATLTGDNGNWLKDQLTVMANELRGVRPEVSKNERAIRITNVAMMEAQRLYGDKFAFSCVIAYKEEGKGTLVDTGSNVSMKDTAVLFNWGKEISAKSVEVPNPNYKFMLKNVVIADAEGNVDGGG